MAPRLLECRGSDSSRGRPLPARRWRQAENEAGITLHSRDVHAQTNENSRAEPKSYSPGGGASLEKEGLTLSFPEAKFKSSPATSVGFS